jgi:pimeloyl-ACP methyl ester carboxylesterase
MSVQAPKGFVATATLSADTPAQQSGAKKATRKMRGSSKVALNEGLANAPSLNVLELKGIQGKLSEANPLKINIQNIEKDDHVIALQYDEKSGLYFPVGRSVDGVIHITDTPQVAQDVATRSLFGTVKILFQKLIVSKLTGEFEYPLLRMAQFESNQDEKFTYVNDLKSIESAIESAENIVLFIHGMVGDTGEMTKSVIRAKKKEKPLLDNYQLVLTFDYDSVSTPIEETAKDLKARLEALGLVAGHGRKLDIIAHSIGGLVSRYFIEKLEGNQVVTRLIQLGVPNNGTEITQLKDVIKTYSMLAINGLPALQPWMTPLTLFANYLVKNIQVTIDQLKPTSDLLKKLNDGSDPGIPYHIIAGNTRLIKKTYPKETTFIQKVYENLKSQGLYYILEQSLFKSDNDLVVRTESAKSIAGKEAWANPVTEVEIANDHLSYFYKPEGLKALVDVVYGKKP